MVICLCMDLFISSQLTSIFLLWFFLLMPTLISIPCHKTFHMGQQIKRQKYLSLLLINIEYICFHFCTCLYSNYQCISHNLKYHVVPNILAYKGCRIWFSTCWYGYENTLGIYKPNRQWIKEIRQYLIKLNLHVIGAILE